MIAIKKSTNQRVFFTFFFLVLLLPVSLVASILPIDVLKVFAADSPLEEVDPLITESNTAIDKASASIEKLTKIKAELEKVKDLKKVSKNSTDALEALRDFLEKEKYLETSLKSATDSVTEFTGFETKIDALNTRVGNLPTSTTVEAAKTKLKDQKTKVTNKKTELTKAKDALTDPATNAVKATNLIVTDFETQANTGFEQDGTIESLLKKLPEQFSGLNVLYDTHGALEKPLAPLVGQFQKIVPALAPDPSKKLQSVKASLDAFNGKIAGWLDDLTADVLKTDKKLIDMRGELDKDLPKNVVEAIKLLDESERKEKILSTIPSLAEKTAEKTKTDAIKSAADRLDEILTELRSRNLLVREGLAGDYGKFINDFVPLYYFTDVFNLMRVLNPTTQEIRDVSALRKEAEARRREVDRADLDLASISETVSSLQVRKRNLVNELNDAENEFTSASSLLAQATRRLSRFAADDSKRRPFKEQVDDRTEQKDAAKIKYDALKDENTGLPKQIKDAETQLLAAQKAVREARNNLIILSQNESDAFAEARDNEPVYFARNEVTSKDPIKQVIIYAFGNRKIIYLRGTPENVSRVKNIIAFFDRPAPQARLSLWTLELNGQATKKGSEAFNKSLEIVDTQLSNTRAQIAVTLSVLRRSINEKVNNVAEGKLNEIPNYDREKIQFNGNAIDIERWARSFFYQNEVLNRLGFDRTPPGKDNSAQVKIIARNTLPNPVGAGTLGEALVILSLAKPEYRDAILDDFTDKLPKAVGDVTVKFKDGKDKEDKKLPPIDKNSFNLTKTALDYGNCQDLKNNCAVKQKFTPIQKEIVSSITLASIPRLIRRLNQFDKIGESWAVSKPKKEAEDNLKKEIGSVIDFLWYSYGISSTDLFGFDTTPDEGAKMLVDDLANYNKDKTGNDKKEDQAENDKKEIENNKEKKKNRIQQMIKRLGEIREGQNIFRLANAQIARTDNMVKQLIDAFDEDLNRSIVMPSVYGLRKNLVERKIAVGIINRTSVLSTNRLIARVDARGSAQLTVGEEQDALLAAQQLVNLFMAAKTGGLLGGFGGLNSMKQERETSEVYGINSGSVFKVTPFFDPSGQALRFLFDHTMANLVTEPDGSIQPAMPRIERHTVNTEVQLSNLELREISRFEANAKLGIPTTYKGGIPIFKDIPYVNKVPLLGWFTRRAGKAAVIQESLILGQTTMYPTIADMFDLLSGDDYNIESQKTNEILPLTGPNPTPKTDEKPNP